jgi:hypothetical protein
MGDCAGFIKESQNGKFIFVGFGINQRFKYQNELIKSILENADVKPVLLIKGDDEIHASLLNCGERYCLFVANFHEEPKKGTILIKKDDLSCEVEVYLEPRKSKIISL